MSVLSHLSEKEHLDQVEVVRSLREVGRFLNFASKFIYFRIVTLST